MCYVGSVVVFHCSFVIQHLVEESYSCYSVQSQLPDYMLITTFCVCSGNTSLFTQTKLVNVRLITWNKSYYCICIGSTSMFIHYPSLKLCFINIFH